MIPIDLQGLLTPRDPAHPSGDDLAYRPDFVELMQLAAGTPEVEYGSMRLAATEPPWAEIETRAGTLLTESRDLRLATLLARALLARHGIEGLAAGLGLIAGLLRLDWEGVHPRLDPEDALDPTERINILLELSAPAFLTRLGATPVIELPLLGRLTLTALTPEAGADGGRGGLTQESLAAALRDAEPALVDAAAQRLVDCLTAAQSIEHSVNTCTACAHSLSLAPLADALEPALGLLCQGGRHAPAAVAEASDTVAGIGGGITSRADIARQIDRICDYYRQHEPASPVPILLQRARRLLDMDFLEIMADLAPNALPDIQALSGPPRD